MINIANNGFIGKSLLTSVLRSRDSAVVIQYRLGVFGFLASDQMIHSNGLNTGITDARFALQWVQDYIGLFGGDKNTVTSEWQNSIVPHVLMLRI